MEKSESVEIRVNLLLFVFAGCGGTEGSLIFSDNVREVLDPLCQSIA